MKRTKKSSKQVRKGRKVSRFTFLQNAFIKRISLVLFASIFLLWSITFLWQGGYFSKAWQGLINFYYEKTIDLGFEVEEVLVEGRVNTPADALWALINVNQGDAFFALNPKGIKRQVEKISWVKTASVQRKPPNTLVVKLQERVPAAYWRLDGKKESYAIIDVEGVILDETYQFKNEDFLVLYGAEANNNFQTLYEILTTNPELYKEFKAASFIGNRRWDVITKKNIRIQFPEKDSTLAYSILDRMEKDKNILERKVKIIDLRQIEKVILKTDKGKAEDLIPLQN